MKREAVSRSLRTYHAPGRAAALDGFYCRFLGAGDLAFDVGAHVGDRMLSFRRLGARVVAVEPQRALGRVLRLLLRGDPDVALVSQLIGARMGEAELRLNTANPTVATASAAFIAAAVQGELDRVSQMLTGRIRQLTERHVTPLPQFVTEVDFLAAKVAKHSQKMVYTSSN